MSAAAQRDFALDVVRRLREAGYESLWAGGCVRDQLLGRSPQDYDVATDATPDQIRAVFGRRRTLSIGASFGVITVLGSKAAGQIEVATFRQDSTYSDGRHPDAVTFSSAEIDAQRRDFTINGLFYDPLADEVIDFVGGQQDLHAKCIRAIGNPDERIAEDKLRMLRAVRFAATFDFELETETFQAVVRHSSEISQVSAERITAELRRMWGHTNHRQATRLLIETRLLAAIVPAAEPFNDKQQLGRLFNYLDQVEQPDFRISLSCVLLILGCVNRDEIVALCDSWRMTNEESRVVVAALKYRDRLLAADQLSWPQLQRILIHRDIDQMIQFAAATSDDTAHRRALEYCRDRLNLPPQQLNPQPLIDGNDLLQMGVPAGPQIKTILAAVRDAQLDQIVATRDEAIAMAAELM